MIKGRKTLNIAYILLVALFVSLCLSFFTPLNIPKAATHPSLSGGSGTANDPYLISTATDMTYLSNHVMNGGETSGKYYKLTNAINMLNKNFTPIGTLRSNGTTYYFEGNFDGNNCIIYNLSISNNGYASGDLGLFGYLKGTVKNVRLAGGTIKLTYTYKSAGGIVGSAYDSAKIENCSNTGVTVTCPEGSYGDQFIGGILGYTDYSNVTIKSCFNLQNISNLTYGIARVGGIAGKCVGTISECYNAGTITGGVDGKSTESYVGGIAGVDATINYCYNKGSIRAYATLIEGSTGSVSTYSDYYFALSGNTSSGYEEVKAYSGGICGYTSNNIKNSYNTATINGGYRREYSRFGYNPYDTFTGNTSYGKYISDTFNTKVTIYSGSIVGDGTNPSSCFSIGSVNSVGYEYSLEYENKTYASGGNTTVVSDSEDFLFIPIPIEYNYTLKNGRISLVVNDSNFVIRIYGDTEYKKDYFDFIPTNSSSGKIDKNILTFNRTKNYISKNVTNTSITINNLGGTTIWQTNDYINNGYPYLKSIYWSGGAQDFNS